MGALFISDLHLDPEHPEILGQFLDFLRDEAMGAESFYILGDLFESWIGDDDTDREKKKITQSLAKVSASGVPSYFMRGNRDFLIGEQFADQTGFRILEDPAVVLDLYGTMVLVMHGDTLCTDDVSYQQFRAMVRNPAWQRTFLSKPLEARRAMATMARERSEAHTRNSASEIMDVNQETVEKTMQEYGVSTLLHGHTHRPNVHHFDVDGEPMTRIVLGDWHDHGSVLRWDETGYDLQTLPR